MFGAQATLATAPAASSSAPARALALALALAAAYLLLGAPPSRPGLERAGPGRDGAPPPPPGDRHGLLPTARAPADERERGRASADERFRFMGEMRAVVEDLERHVSSRRNAGAVEEAARHVRAFCRHAYRVLGRDPASSSREDARTALGDAALLQARAVNCIASLHMTTNRSRRREALRSAESVFARSSEAHIRELRRVLDSAPGGANRGRSGAGGAYEPGRGFPAPWAAPLAEGHAEYAAGAEARYALCSEP